MNGQILRAGEFGGEWKRVYTYGDGSCFFHSLAIVLFGQVYAEASKKDQIEVGHKLRDVIVDEEEYTNFLRAQGFLHVPGVVQPHEAGQVGTHADEALINFTAKRLNLNLCILVSPTEKYVREVDEQAPWAILAWIKRFHFEPIVYQELSSFTAETGLEELPELPKKHYLVEPTDPMIVWLKK